jgi:small GTP-binding protein
MTNGIVLEGPLAELREREVRLLFDAAEYVGKIGAEGDADKKRLLETASDLREMFMLVVIIGEFNAGKSTFVNALLGDSLLPTGIIPTTDAIELVRYAPTKSRQPESSGEAIREWRHPNTGAPGVVIVDTPGTGSVFQKHEQVAKSFLHRSDLVIFLLSAKRAFAETERLYLELARSYGKKVVIVINQVDLLDNREQSEVREFVQHQADELLNLRPPLFMVSAKKSLQGEKSGLFGSAIARGDWGMDAVRDYLRQTFEQVPPAKQKLLTQLELARSVTTRYKQSAQARLALVSNDTAQAEDLKKELEKQAGALDQQLAGTLVELGKVFSELHKRGQIFIESHVSVTRAIRGLDNEKLRADFETEVLAGATNKITAISEQYVNAMVDGGRSYWRSVIDRLNKLDAMLKAESGTLDAATYADQRAALQAALAAAAGEMKTYTDNRVLEGLQETFTQNVRGFALSVTGALGGVLAFLLSAATGISAAHGLTIVFGVVFAPIALVGGGIGAAWFSRKATRDSRTHLDDSLRKLEDGYRDSLTDMTTRERTRLVQYGQQILAPVFSQLQVLAQRYREQVTEIDGFSDRATRLANEIEAVSTPQPVG